MSRSINYVFSTKIWIFIWFLFFSTPILRANSCHPDPNISCWPALDVRTLVEGINYDHFRSVIYMSPGNVGYSSAMELFQNSHGWDLNVVGTISQDTNGEIENTYDGGHDDIEAVFKVVFNEPTSVLIAIKPEVPEANLDLFVVQGERPSGNFIDVDSAFDPDIDVSAAAGGNESVARVFAPGTYYILVSLLEGDSCATTSFGLLLTERPIYLNCFNVQDDVSRQMVSTWVDPSDYNGLADWSWLNWTGVKYGPCLAQNPGDDLGENSLVGSKILAIPNGAAPIIDFDVALFTEEPLPDEPVFSLFTESKNSQSLNYVSGFSFASGTSGIPMTINGNNGYLFPWSSWRQTVLSLGGTENEFTLSPCSGTGIVLNGQNQNEMWLIDNLRVFRVIETDFAICVPDPNFKAFLVAHYDSNGDGEIQLSEAGAARGDLNTPGNDSSRGNISDLTGIEHFTGISSLNCSYEQLSALPDLSALGNLQWLNFSHNYLTTLPDLSALGNLQSLHCESNQLTTLPDVTSCNTLRYFYCEHNYFGPDDCAMIDAIEAMELPKFEYSPNANGSIIDCALPGFTLTASAGSNGRITPSGTIEVFQGNTFSFFMIPDSGYTVLDVVVDGTSVGPTFGYTFTNIQTSHTISVTFQLDFTIAIPDPIFKASLVAQYDSNGDGEIQASEAGAVRDTLYTPGTYISPGNISDLTGIEYFTGIKSLNCSHEQLTTLPDMSTLVNLHYLYCNSNQLTTLPDMSALGNLQSLYCDSNQLTDIPDVTSCNSLCHFDCAHNYFGPDDCAMIDAIEAMGFSGFVYSPNANDSIIDCALPGFTLTASADSNGSITPSGTFEVFQGNTVSFYMLPDSGYAVLDVVVDGSSMGPQYVYTFTNIQANHAISVTFQPDFTITTIPDPNFKAFLVAHYDSNGDGEIQASEAGAVRDTLYTPGTPISPGNISDLTGIEYFTGISNLYCPYQQLTTLPVSNLINLQKLYCYYNQLNTLPNLSALVNLQYLYCESNQLTTLPDLSALVNLQYLYCESNQLTTLPDLSALVNLQYLYCESNQLTTLPDLSALANLRELDCRHNQLTTLPDLSALGNLQRLYCSSNQLTNIPDVTGCNNLISLYCNHNHFGPDDCAMIDAIEAMGPFVYFTYSPNANGSIIDCSLPTLTLTASTDSNGSIDPSGAVEVFQGNTLSFYMIPNSGYTVLDAVVDGTSVGPSFGYTFTNVQANHTISVSFQSDFTIVIPDPNFKAFLVANYDSNGDGEIQASEAGAVRGTLDTPGTDDSPGNISDLTGIEYFTGISTLISSNEQLTALPDLAGLMNLQWLDCSSNQLSGLPDLSTLGNLQYLDCSSNQLTTLPDLSTLGNLQYLYCDSNQLTTLPDLSALANLYWLYCSSNQLTMLPDLAGLEHLYRLDCSSNQLTTLPDLVGLEYLYRLDCSSNQLTALPNLSDLANLLYLYCDSNQLTTLPDLSALRNLQYLYCSSNQLTTLPDLFVLRHLQYLDCSSNQLTTLPDLFVLWNLYWFDCDHNQLTDIPNVTGCNQLRYFYCDHNHFGPDDCAMINAIKAMRIWEFVYSPNADGSVIDCTTR